MAGEDFRAAPSPQRGDPPHRFLMLGDFSGRGGRQQRPDRTEHRSAISVDVDNFDQVFSRLRPTLSVSLAERGGATTTVEFHSLDDFHPDSLMESVDALRALGTARERLRAGTLDPAIVEALAGQLPTVPDGQGGEPAEPGTPAEDEGDAATLERLLGERPAAVSRPSGTPISPDLSAWLKQLVEPHVVPARDRRHEELVKACDEAVTGLLRYVLGQPQFQALEALWRSVHRIVREVDTNECVEFDLLDVTRAELVSDLQSAADWRNSDLYRRLRDAGRGWSLLVGDFAFGNGPDDVLLLASLGALAAEVKAPWLSAAKPEVCGCRAVHELPEPERWPPIAAAHAESWRKLRTSEMARWLGLAMPRVLLRLPYGAATEPIERFPFEEMTAPDSHEQLLWGNPAFACACVAAEAIAGGRGADAGPLELGDLPPYTFPTEDGPQLKACSEVYLSDRAAMAILARGVMPLLSQRNRNAVRLGRWQSLAEPPTRLAIPG